MPDDAIDFYRSLRTFVRLLEENGDAPLPYDSARGFSRYMQAGSRAGADKLNRYFGRFLEADHLVEKRFLGHLPAASLDTSEWDAKFVPKNKSAASMLNKFRAKPFPYIHSVKTYALKRLIPHGLEGMFTPQEIWDAHAWTFKQLGIESELLRLKPYFRNARVKFRIPKRDPRDRKGWKERADLKLVRDKSAPKPDPPDSKKVRRTQRALERARQRQARERAKARVLDSSEATGPADTGTATRGTTDRGTSSRGIAGRLRPGATEGPEAPSGPPASRRVRARPPRLAIRGAAGKALGGAIVMFGLGYLQAWGIQKSDEYAFRRELARLDSKIRDRMDAAQGAVEEHYAMWPDKPMYLTLPIHLRYLNQAAISGGEFLTTTNLVGVEIAPGPAPIYPFPLEDEPTFFSAVDKWGFEVRATTLPIPMELQFGSPSERIAFLKTIEARRHELVRAANESQRPLVNIQIAPRENPIRKFTAQ